MRPHLQETSGHGHPPRVWNYSTPILICPRKTRNIRHSLGKLICWLVADFTYCWKSHILLRWCIVWGNVWPWVRTFQSVFETGGSCQVMSNKSLHYSCKWSPLWFEAGFPSAHQFHCDMVVMSIGCVAYWSCKFPCSFSILHCHGSVTWEMNMEIPTYLSW